MDNIQNKIEHLLKLYLTDQASPEELEEFWDFTSDPVYGEILERLIEKAYHQEESLVSASEKQRKMILENIFSSEQPKAPIRKIRLWPRIGIAAAVVVALVSAGIWFYSKNLNEGLTKNLEYANDIAPGKNGATLTLADGRKILINDALAGNIANEAGVKITKTKDGQLIYEVTGNDGNNLTYNTLSTTRGEQSQVRLPDGSLVFLNAESSLKYPTNFKRYAKREVFLSGEGYFEVAKDKAHPFIVKGEKQEVEVLGTHFNIESYSKSSKIKTTLLEGSVKIITKTGISKILKPNQQMVLTEKGTDVRDIEAEYVIAWKEGFFIFNNESLENIMAQIALWYNVEVLYEDASLKKETFLGTISKFENVSKVLKMLEKTKVAKFNIEKNKIIIARKNK
ncbi:FecR domain-containing protein [Pedobacter sp. Du54]|uniref:FecR family protein n=1 Tax=Pedobacter anseongensis TaxID=3133439 RepID=UPI00309706F7